MFSQEVADQVLAGLTEGRSLRTSAKEAGTSHSTVLEWLDKPEHAVFADQYARVRAHSYAMLGDEILEIVDEPGDAADKRLRFDARRWMLSKMLPKVYGDKLDVAHSGGVTVLMTPTDAAL